jgi:hypothetical protein
LREKELICLRRGDRYRARVAAVAPRRIEGMVMTAFNIVRFKVKPGHARAFIAGHKRLKPKFKGFRGGALVRTGDRTFCIVGEWSNFKALAKARPEMIGILDGLRKHLAKVGRTGLTDPVSGEMVVRLKASKRATRKTRRKKRR